MQAGGIVELCLREGCHPDVFQSGNQIFWNLNRDVYHSIQLINTLTKCPLCTVCGPLVGAGGPGRAEMWLPPSAARHLTGRQK